MHMNKPGVILISTLLVVMMMSIISIQISKKFFVSIQREAYLDFKNHSYEMLLSSEAQAIKSIEKQIIGYQNKLTHRNPILNNSFFYTNDLATIEIKVRDGSNCFNLNSIFKKSKNGRKVHQANREWLERILRLKRLQESDIESFLDQLIDWVDIDNQPLNFGAENYFYTGPLSPINQFTPKRLLLDLSELRNFPVVDTLNFEGFSQNLCVLPGRTNQLINVNTLSSNHTILMAAFFDEENLEFIESQIIDIPKEGYDSTDFFVNKITQSKDFPLQVLSTNSKNFILKGQIYNESFSNELESLVILDISNSARVLNRSFNY
jgi:general secretion pathway protein K